MEDQMASQTYESPRVVDYGDLQELTAACLGAAGSDGVYPGKSGLFFGASNPAKPGCEHGHLH